jgi:hypothetical protein
MDARLNNSSLLDESSRVMYQSRDTENNVASGEFEVKQTYGEYAVK